MVFQPGQSGNPGGRPKTQKMFRDALMVSLKRATEEGVEAIQKIADSLVNKAAFGDVPAIKEIADRIDGKVPQGIGGDDELPAIQHEMTIQGLLERIEQRGKRINDTD